MIGNLKHYININNMKNIKNKYIYKNYYYNVIIPLVFYVLNIKYTVLVCSIFGKHFKLYPFNYGIFLIYSQIIFYN
ncbi:hypothetical protein C923_00157 [Plasmodium falciparum UGT5.1]|uniref:Uncharacterized protein n=1 Tax=Plasmodium falciparum UGT5.1 TaxID=1237627 RepID=W7JKB5_PLAFA|nr:hypothetical protein C923_00157 [Plasmodium falciparum UGT5.1]